MAVATVGINVLASCDVVVVVSLMAEVVVLVVAVRLLVALLLLEQVLLLLQLYDKFIANHKKMPNTIRTHATRGSQQSHGKNLKHHKGANKNQV